MGLSVAIAGGIVMFALVYILLMLPGVVDQTTSVTKASSEISGIDNSILKTNIGMSSLSASSGSTTIDLTVTSSGTEKLWNYEKFNLIITYPIAGNTNKTESFTYQSGICASPTAGRWCITSITSDAIDPNILNTNEALNARATSSQMLSSGTVYGTISTERGVTATRALTIP
jgi:archaellum component FlaF (FlaF/FlaG flagellin family)